MKIVHLYNEQRAEFGGEVTAIANTTRILRSHGHEVIMAVRSSRTIGNNILRKLHAGVSGIYSFSAVSEINTLVAREKPDIIHAHGVYPMWSPSIFPACKRIGVPTLLHVHGHYLTCPTWYHLRNSMVCTRCANGKEYWCLLTNCRNNYAESAAYALRSTIARRMRLFSDHVGIFITVSEFLRQHLIHAGYPADRIRVVRNVVSYTPGMPNKRGFKGEYVGYCGRLSPEKGVHTLVEAARRTSLPVRIAGDGPDREQLERSAPSNVQFLGFLQGNALDQFYENSRFIVLPSISSETFLLAAAESMMHGRPVIASRIGAIPELVIEGRTGLLFQPGDAEHLSALMAGLWRDEQLCEQYGRAGQEIAACEFGEGEYYSHLMNAYRSAAGETSFPEQGEPSSPIRVNLPLTTHAAPSFKDTASTP